MFWFHRAADFSSVSRCGYTIDFTSIINVDDLYQSYSWLLSCVHEQKTQWACIMHWVGTVNRRGYVSQQKTTICDAHGPYPSTWRTLKPVFHRIWLIRCAYESLRRLHLEIWRFLCSRRQWRQQWHDCNTRSKAVVLLWSACYSCS